MNSWVASTSVLSASSRVQLTTLPDSGPSQGMPVTVTVTAQEQPAHLWGSRLPAGMSLPHLPSPGVPSQMPLSVYWLLRKQVTAYLQGERFEV